VSVNVLRMAREIVSVTLKKRTVFSIETKDFRDLFPRRYWGCRIDLQAVTPVGIDTFHPDNPNILMISTIGAFGDTEGTMDFCFRQITLSNT